MDTHSHDSIRNRNRKTLLVALSVFAIPFLAALILHKTGLYQSVGTTNHGELISPPVAFESLPLADAQANQIEPSSLNKTWWMVYVIPEQCDASCKNSLYQMRQIQLALGPDKKRVATMLIAAHDLPQEYADLIGKEFPEMKISYTQAAELQNWFADTENTTLKTNQTGYIYLVDTMGAVFMYYPTYADEQQSILKGRDLLKDLQKVLKLSKIG